MNWKLQDVVRVLKSTLPLPYGSEWWSWKEVILPEWVVAHTAGTGTVPADYLEKLQAAARGSDSFSVEEVEYSDRLTVKFYSSSFIY